MTDQTTRGERTPVKRQGAERYLLLSLVSFAISVILTRIFLQLKKDEWARYCGQITQWEFDQYWEAIP